MAGQRLDPIPLWIYLKPDDHYRILHNITEKTRSIATPGGGGGVTNNNMRRRGTKANRNVRQSYDVGTCML